MNNIKYNT